MHVISRFPTICPDLFYFFITHEATAMSFKMSSIQRVASSEYTPTDLTPGLQQEILSSKTWEYYSIYRDYHEIGAFLPAAGLRNNRRRLYDRDAMMFRILPARLRALTRRTQRWNGNLFLRCCSYIVRLNIRNCRLRATGSWLLCRVTLGSRDMILGRWRGFADISQSSCLPSVSLRIYPVPVHDRCLPSGRFGSPPHFWNREIFYG